GIGDDFLSGGTGNDLLIGDDGDLTGDGNDLLFGGEGDDQLYGVDGDNELYGDDGHDLLLSGDGVDYLSGGAGADYLDAGAGDDILEGGSENDVLLGKEGADFLYGGTGDDELWGYEDDDFLYGEGDNDVLVGQDGNDELYGGAGDDDLYGDNSDGSGSGQDVLDGGAGNDYLAGHGGVDLLLGGTGNDLLEGGSGDDEIVGGANRDQLKGEGGDDIYRFYSSDGADFIEDNQGNSSLHFEDVYTLADLTIRVGDRSTGNFHSTPEGKDLLIQHGTTDSVFFDNALNNNFTVVLGSGSTYTPLQLLAYTAQTVTGNNESEVLTGGSGTDSIYGYGGNDTISGGEGHDNIQGGLGNDILQGEGGDDTLIDGPGNDTLLGGPGNDQYLLVGEGVDVIDDPEGANIISLPSSFAKLSYVTFENGSIAATDQGNDLLINHDNGQAVIIKGRGYLNNTYEFESGQSYSHLDLLYYVDETLVGTEGSDVIYAQGGDDTVIAKGGDDTIYGGDGNDILNGGAGADLLDGAEGRDTVDYSESFEPVTIDLLSGTASGGDAEGDTLNNIEGIVGSQFSDILTGSSSNNHLAGKAGDDEYHLLSGIDYIEDSEGENSVFIQSPYQDIYYCSYEYGELAPYFGRTDLKIEYADGEVIIAGGKYALDMTFYFDGVSYSHAELLTDVSEELKGTTGNDVIYGLGGNDTIEGFQGNDKLFGGDGNDSIIAWDGDDLIHGGSGLDRLYGGAGNDVFIYKEGDDDLTLNSFGQWNVNTDDQSCIDGGTGFDVIDFSNLTKPIRYFNNNHSNIELVVGTDYNDYMVDEDSGGSVFHGEKGSDFIIGSTHANVFYGDEGDDFLYSDGGNDRFYGGTGNDTLLGSEGNDILDGGPGDDWVNYYFSLSSVYVDLGKAVARGGDAEGDILKSIENIQGSFFNADTLIGNSSNNVFEVGDGDSAYGMGGADTLWVNDTENQGTVLLEGGSGDDVLGSINYAGSHAYYGQDGKDILLSLDDPLESIPDQIANQPYVLDGGSGNDFLCSTQFDTIYGGSGDDILIKAIIGTTLYGGSGNDIISGGNFVKSAPIVQETPDPNLENYSLDDIIIGGSGNDLLQGGAGDDTYSFAAGDGKDIIWDEHGQSTV
ncbi:MAG: calcium-binding protein, partial [Desulfobulbaceae bacterium]|nr:calcium-binding protein [Desulfobulbaceae bacterium]